MKPFLLPIRVRFAETDAMGIVHHSNYFAYLEAARIALLDELGLPYTKLIELGFHLPLVSAQINFRTPAKFDDRLEIETLMQPMSGATFTIGYKIRRGSDLLAEASTTHAFINSSGQAVRPPKEFLAIVGKSA